jgi:hypothetical protein
MKTLIWSLLVCAIVLPAYVAASDRPNLVVKNAPKRDELLDELLAWFQSTNALIPNERNPNYDAFAGTSEAKSHSKKNRNKKP